MPENAPKILKRATREVRYAQGALRAGCATRRVRYAQGALRAGCATRRVRYAQVVLAYACATFVSRAGGKI
jgi:hypothetical protein